MRFKFLVFLLFFILTSNVFSQFQGFDWGTTRDKIIAEWGPPIKDREYAIAYQPDRDNPNYAVVFFFLNNGSLVKGRMGWVYFLYESRDSWNKMEEVKSILLFKYGEPVIDELKWSGSVSDSSKQLYSDNPLGAIEMKYAKLYSLWQLNNLSIALTLDNDDGYWLLVEYVDPENIVLFENQEAIRSGSLF